MNGFNVQSLSNISKMVREQSRNFFIFNQVTFGLLLMISWGLFGFTWETLFKISLVTISFLVWGYVAMNNLFIARYGFSLFSLLTLLNNNPDFIHPSALNHIFKGNLGGHIALNLKSPSDLADWMVHAKLVKPLTKEETKAIIEKVSKKYDESDTE